MSTVTHTKIILTALISSLFVVLIILAGLAVAAYQYKDELMSYVQNEYVSTTQDRTQSGTTSPQLLVGEEIITDIIAEVNPAVVSIVVSKDVPVYERYYEDVFPFGDLFEFQVPQMRERGTQEREVGGGSGFIVTPDGLVVTNRHVVSDVDATYTLFTSDGEQYEATAVARDPFFDIAVLQIESEETFPTVAFGNSDALQLGQTVIAIGNALAEFRNSVSVGVVSGLARNVVAGSGFFGEQELLEEVIQTDAAINPGNSGGPLLNTAGEVIGINVAVIRGSENIGFAIPSNVVKTVVESVKEYGEIVRPYLGVRYRQITKTLAEANDLPVEYGALIIRGDSPEELAVIPGSPADRAGLVENDIILSIDGTRITDNRTLAAIIRTKQVSETIELTVLHNGKEVTKTATLGKAPENL